MEETAVPRELVGEELEPMEGNMGVIEAVSPDGANMPLLNKLPDCNDVVVDPEIWLLAPKTGKTKAWATTMKSMQSAIAPFPFGILSTPQLKAIVDGN